MPPVSDDRRRTRRRLWVVAAVLVGALVFLLVEGLGSSLDYFDTVDQALAHRATLGTSTFRLEGVVVPGTHPPDRGRHRLLVSQRVPTRSPVRNTGSPPQLFQQDIPVVVVGHFASSTSTRVRLRTRSW